MVNITIADIKKEGLLCSALKGEAVRSMVCTKAAVNSVLFLTDLKPK
jgi:hypothetical protein